MNFPERACTSAVGSCKYIIQRPHTSEVGRDEELDINVMTKVQTSEMMFLDELLLVHFNMLNKYTYNSDINLFSSPRMLNGGDPSSDRVY